MFETEKCNLSRLLIYTLAPILYNLNKKLDKRNDFNPN